MTAAAWSLPGSSQRFVACSLVPDNTGNADEQNVDAAQGEWLADGSESNTKFEGLELTDGEWFDYDEKAGEEVSIKEAKWEIIRA